MSKNKNNLKHESSSVGQFVAREIPADKQAKRFDHYLRGDVDEGSVDESLSEIYQDESGKRINIKQVEIKPRRSFFTRLGIILIYILAALVIAGGVYYWLVNRGADSTAVDFKISAPEQLVANQEFEYTIDYNNKENLSLTNLELDVIYPDNFIFESSFPSPTENNNKWKLEDLRQYSSGQVKIKGRLIAPVGSSNMIFADLNYRPSNISSDFKKSTSLETILANSGLDLSAVAPTSVLVGQDNELVIKYKAQDTKYFDHFTIRFGALDNLTFPKTDYGPDVTMSDLGVFTVSTIPTEEKELHLKFRFSDKKNDSEQLKVTFEYQGANDSKSYAFDEKDFTIEVVKNSLNLTIVANGQPSDQGIDFGQTINYSISYVNKGTEPMTDVVIMAVLDGDALDWHNLIDKNNGVVTGRTITWTKDQLPELKSLATNQEGSIDFSIPVRDVNEAKLISNFEVKSYAQFAIGGKTEDLSSDNTTNRSNQLIVRVNSDTALDESVRYFDQDNIAVGTGPLPPQVGQTSTFKVYWKITNNLHELGDLQVTTKLPDYITWDGKEQADVGTITYDKASNTVTWSIGRLPLSANLINAEFSIALKPKSTDRNKLLVLVSGTVLSGTDNTTTFPVSQTLKAQTTRLEKDDIASTDGIIQ
jgi:uncharacterized repeat protein (TIGR01451 family)